jgi:hypothetical protein
VKIRLYLDEDSMSRSLVRALRSRGVDVMTALDAGMIGGMSVSLAPWHAVRPDQRWFGRTTVR